MPVRVQVNILGVGDFTRVVQNRARLTPRQAERIGEGLVRSLNGPRSEWPRKGQGVRGGASGASRRRFKASVRQRSNGDVIVSLTNTSTGRDRQRALGRRGGNRRRYAKYPEIGTPNPRSAGRAARTIRRTLPRVLRRVLGEGWDVAPIPPGGARPRPLPAGGNIRAIRRAIERVPERSRRPRRSRT